MKIKNKQELKNLIPKVYVKRAIHKELLNHIHQKEVTLLYGARQVGKSSEVYKCIYDLLREDEGLDIFYYNLDYIEVVNSKDFQDPEVLLGSITSQRTNDSKTTYIFIDEAQRLKNIGIFVKYLYDKRLNIKFVLTGSASLEIKEKIKEPLTGRKKEFVLYPLNLKEYLTFKGIGVSSITENFDLLIKSVDEYLLFGGYPDVATTNDLQGKKDKLLEIADSYINKDITDLHNVQDPNQVRLAISYLASVIGSTFSVDALCGSTGMTRYKAEKLIDTYEKTFVINKIKPFYRNRVKELTHQPKVYFTDIGFRNAILNRLDEVLLIKEKGAVFENMIANELGAKYGYGNLKFWRNINQTEVDFVVEESFDRLRAYEVKFNWENNSLPKNLRSFINSYSHQIISKAVITKTNFWEVWK